MTTNLCERKLEAGTSVGRIQHIDLILNHLVGNVSFPCGRIVNDVEDGLDGDSIGRKSTAGLRVTMKSVLVAAALGLGGTTSSFHLFFFVVGELDVLRQCLGNGVCILVRNHGTKSMVVVVMVLFVTGEVLFMPQRGYGQQE